MSRALVGNVVKALPGNLGHHLEKRVGNAHNWITSSERFKRMCHSSFKTMVPPVLPTCTHGKQRGHADSGRVTRARLLRCCAVALPPACLH